MQASVLPFIWPIGPILEHQPNLLFYRFMTLQFNKLRFPGLSHAALIKRTNKLGFPRKKTSWALIKQECLCQGLYAGFSSAAEVIEWYFSLVSGHIGPVRFRFSYNFGTTNTINSFFFFYLGEGEIKVGYSTTKSLSYSSAGIQMLYCEYKIELKNECCIRCR